MKRPDSDTIARVCGLVLGVTVIWMAGSMIADLSPNALGAEPGRLNLAAGRDRVADRMLTAPTPTNLNLAADASRAALTQAPYDTGALLRLAYLDWKRGEHLGKAGVQALDASYRRIPIDRAAGFWRIQFALENWDVLPLDLRRAVQSEVFAMASEPGHRWPLRARLSRIHNAKGRVVAAVWTTRIADRMSQRSA